MNQNDDNTEFSEINPEGKERQCDNCKAPVAVNDMMCTRCGFSLSPVRSTKTKWRGISFPVFVFWVSIFCVLMIFWLPR